MKYKRILSQAALVAGVLVFSAGVQTFAQTWTPPSTSPPNSNAWAPLNTGPNAQSKVGGLLLNTGGAVNGLIVQNGNVGIGTAGPNTALEVNRGANTRIRVGGGLGVGFEFADAGTRLDIPAGNTLAAYTSNIERLRINNVGNVGIGTTNPGAKLDVAGDIKIGNSQANCTSTNEGAQRYNSTNKLIQYCNGVNWLSFATITPPPPSPSCVNVGTKCMPEGSAISCGGIGGTFQARISGLKLQTRAWANSGGIGCDSGWVDGGPASCVLNQDKGVIRTSLIFNGISGARTCSSNNLPWEPCTGTSACSVLW